MPTAIFGNISAAADKPDQRNCKLPRQAKGVVVGECQIRTSEIRRFGVGGDGVWQPSMTLSDNKPPQQKASGEGSETSPVSRDARVLAFIPTLNDRDLLGELAREVAAFGDNFAILVIDDGSSPAIEKSLLPDGCLLFCVPLNVGLGVCSHIAFDHALAHGYEYLVRMDADGQHPTAMMPALLEPLSRGAADIVVGVRTNHSSNGRPDDPLRRLVKWYFSFLSKTITGGTAPSDVSSGYFAANRRAMQALNSTLLERYPEPQLYSHACRSGLRLTELKISQEKRQHGTSTITYTSALAMIYRFTVYAFGELLRIRR